MDFFSIKDIAEKTGKSQKTIRRHIASGELEAKKIGGNYRIYEESFYTWGNKTEYIKLDKEFEEEKIIKDKNGDVVNYIEIEDMWYRNYWKNRKHKNNLNFIDLFSGAGGMSLGFVMAGFTPVASVEIMPQAVETYRYNFIDKRGFKERVETRDIRENEIKKELYNSVKNIEVDVICGGFPCQGFSMSGNRVVNDERNSLYKEMLEIVKEIQPKFVVMENVVGLRSMLNGKIEKKIIDDYRDIGYEINVTVLNAADYEVPQLRKRVIFIGNRINKKNYHPAPILKEKNYRTTKEAIKDLVKIDNNKEINHEITRHTDEMKKRLLAVKEGESLYENYSDAWKKCPWESPSCTIKENHGGVNIHPKLPRVLTAREMARLQSFPDDFIFKGSKKWQLVQIGNAVPPLLGKAIALAVEKGIMEL